MNSSEYYLQKMNKLNERLPQIRSSLKKVDSPIFVELIGTPKSGKTTLLNNFKQIFEKNNIEFIARRETAEYNPISKDSDNYNLWMIMELYKNLSEDFENGKGKIVIYDRGILDRLPWILKDVDEGSLKPEEADIYKKLYGMNIVKNYKPISYNLITSPQISVERKGKPGKFVNEKSMQKFNECLEKSQDFFKEHSSQYREIVTDPYQGYKQEFIIDVVDSVLNDVEREINRRLDTFDFTEK